MTQSYVFTNFFITALRPTKCRKIEVSVLKYKVKYNKKKIGIWPTVQNIANFIYLKLVLFCSNKMIDIDLRNSQIIRVLSQVIIKSSGIGSTNSTCIGLINTLRRYQNLVSAYPLWSTDYAVAYACAYACVPFFLIDMVTFFLVDHISRGPSPRYLTT